ncbi:MAG TPA: hypothetical protein DCO79_16255, partial [Spirochaeta sp.]|nr:hypothetical protein [Spirochaeta sp.]
LRDLFFTLFLKKPVGLRIGSYRIFTRSAANLISRAAQPFVYISAELFRHGLNAAAISYSKAAPAELPGQSRYSFRARLYLYLRLLRWYMPVIGAISRHAAETASAAGNCPQYIIAEKGGCL